MNMKKYGVIIVSILSLIAFVSASFAAQVQEEMEQTFPLAEEGSVSVENVAGEILIHAWDEDEVKMVATKWVRAFTKKRAQELLEVIEINITANEDQIDIDTEFPWWNQLDPTSSARVDYELWVPPSAQVSAQSVSGSIQVVERENDVWAKTTSGTLEIEGIVGNVEAKTTSGAIEVRDVEGESIVADSTSGKVTLDKVEGIIEAHSVSGRVNIEDSKGAAKSVRTTSGGIWVELKEVTETVSRMLLTSTSGDVTLLLPKDISADIDVQTTSGRIRSEFKILVEGEIEKRSLRGTIGEGGIKITLKTTSGDISLEKA